MCNGGAANLHSPNPRWRTIDTPPQPILLQQPTLDTARRLVVDCLLHPAGDAADAGDPDCDATRLLRRCADVLERIGWPRDPRRVARVGESDAGVIRLAALAALGASAEAVDQAACAAGRDGADWDGDEALQEFLLCVGLLDAVGWPLGSTRGAGDQPASEHPMPAESDHLIDTLPVAIWMLRPDGRTERANAAAATLGGHPLDAVEGPRRERVRTSLDAAMAEGRPLRLIEHLTGDSGRRRHVLDCSPRFASDGSQEGYLVVATPHHETQVGGPVAWSAAPDGTPVFPEGSGLAVADHHLPRVRAAVARTAATGEALYCGVEAVTPTGSHRHVLVGAVTSDGHVHGWCVEDEGFGPDAAAATNTSGDPSADDDLQALTRLARLELGAAAVAVVTFRDGSAHTLAGAGAVEALRLHHPPSATDLGQLCAPIMGAAGRVATLIALPSAEGADEHDHAVLMRWARLAGFVLPQG